MRIEKVNDRQIRCILTGDDLARRNMKLNELAYGSEKARILFRDMMQQASYQYGFEPDDMPLMIEAVPLEGGNIALIVTKVENPDELDTRFSNFGPSVRGNSDFSAAEKPDPSPFEELINTIRSTQPMLTQDAQDPRRMREDPVQRIREFVVTNRLFSFDSMHTVSKAARICAEHYQGESALYFDAAENVYYLYLTMADAESAQKQRSTLALLTEYGHICPLSMARKQYLDEHCERILASNALLQLGRL